MAADPRALQEMLRVSGQQGVPVITVDDEVVIGFDQRRLMQLLAKERESAAGETQVRRPRLGASIADAAAQVRKHPNIPAKGAYVGAVKAGSAAEVAGLRMGDVIVQIGSQPVASAADVHRIVQQLPPARDVAFTFVRDGQERRSVVVRL